MLAKSFLHFRGIGPIQEKRLWENGIFTWDGMIQEKYPLLTEFQQSDENQDILKEYRTALLNKDADLFAEKLNKREHYRIALTFPDATMFLDIETTGLSRHYDAVTLVGWSIGNRYEILLQGGDASKFYEDLACAKVLVTFNGTVFDLPFIRKTYPNVKLPAAHIDLRFLCKRVGMTGGQKIIEETIGVLRHRSIEHLRGEMAPVLWYRYRYGDMNALKNLIIYNHADIEGMKKILDVALRKLWDKEGLPSAIKPSRRFADKKSSISWGKLALRPYTGPKGPRITIDSLLSNSLRNPKIVGIDLTGSEERASGWCYLTGKVAHTKTIHSDQDILNSIRELNPHLISIDSPLSLPEGRITETDDDPGRHKYGIMRRCERMLKKRGINVYPCLIPSMQKLTARGRRLSLILRSEGFPVIESYPGAAQDIMDIPRKRAGLEYLIQGLRSFGIQGDFTNGRANHDELDAITSAVVGMFFWAGYFEALGDNIEEYLIIPNLTAKPRIGKRLVLGFSGSISAGKTTAALMLKREGFATIRFSQILESRLRKEGRPINRYSLQQIGIEVNHTKGEQRRLCYDVIQALGNNARIAIDGLRHPEDHAFMVEHYGPDFYHIHIEANEEIRCDRYIKNGHSPNEFQEACNHSVERNIPRLKNLAHVVIRNEQTKVALRDTLVSIVLSRQMNRS